MIWFVAGVVLGALVVFLVTRHPDDAGPEPVTAPVAGVGPLGAPTEAQRLASVVRVLPIGVLIIDADGDVTYRNDVADGFASGRHGDAIVEGRVRALAAVALRGRSSEDTLDLYGPPRRSLALRADPIFEPFDARPSSTVVLIVDRTEEYRTEVVRRDFVANVSHELRTPVGAIGVLAETLVNADDPEVVDRLAGRLQREAIRLGSTIEDLLTLSSIEGGEGNRDDVAVDDVVRSALDRVGEAAEARDVVLHADDGDGLVVVGDRRQLVSALANLVENAVKYSEPGSTVEITAGEVDAFVEITVADRGQGIPERDLERIFERFYRVDPARSRETGGTGLGLSIVRNIVLGHGGDVDVRSVEGEGSQFTMRLPIAGPDAAERAGSVEAPSIAIGGD